jgi:hypothetical protein
MRMGKIILCGFVALLLIAVVPIAAYSFELNSNTENGNKPTMIVEYGKGKDAGLVKVTHIHYAKSEDKARPKTTTCYKLGGWKWSSPVEYTIIPNQYLTDAVTGAMGTWDSETSRVLFTAPSEGSYPWGGYSDGINSVSFGNYKSSGVIAVTAIWYSRATKLAVESDILFDTDFDWGDATSDPSVMDLQNIATHEIGHTLGLSDLYTDSCDSVTMYGYSTEGDTAKSTLELPDITGLQKLYGI